MQQSVSSLGLSKMLGAGWLGNQCNEFVAVYDCSRRWTLDISPVDVFELTERHRGDVVVMDHTVQDGSLLVMCLVVEARSGCEGSDDVFPDMCSCGTCGS